MLHSAPLYVPDPKLVALAAIYLGGWFLILAGLTITRWPKPVLPGPPTNDLRAEPPAVANLLANAGLANEDALPATLLDLCARGFVSIEDRGDGVIVCRLAHNTAGALRPYERRVLGHLATKERDGVVPAGALTTGPREDSKRWWRDFRKEVAGDTKDGGLAQDFWSKKLSFVMFLLGAPSFLLLEASQGFRDADEVQQSALSMGTTIGMGVGVVVLVVLAATLRVRPTNAGRAATAHWLGVRKNLATLPSFPDLPPTAVQTWERHLAYGAALGVAGQTVKTLPFGAEHDRRAWTHAGGDWRLVRVRYPRFRPGWGSKPWIAIMLGALRVLIGIAAITIVEKIGVLDDLDLGTGKGWVTLIVIVVVSGMFALTLYALLGLFWAVADLGHVGVIEGEVLRTRIKTGPFNSTWASTEDSKERYYVAVYPGTGDGIAAWRVDADMYPRFFQGQLVRVEVSPRLRFVKSVSGVSAIRGA